MAEALFAAAEAHFWLLDTGITPRQVMLAIEEKRGTFDSDAPNFYNLCGGAGVYGILATHAACGACIALGVGTKIALPLGYLLQNSLRMRLVACECSGDSAVAALAFFANLL